MTWTTLHQNITKSIRTRALGALTGVSCAPLTTILRIIKTHLNPYQRATQWIQINSKIYNLQLFMKCASDKKEYQISVLNATSFLTPI